MKQLQSEIADLSEQVERAEDPRTACVLVERGISEFRLKRLAVPEALLKMERRLLDECRAELQGR